MIEKRALYSKQLQREIPLHIYLPENYEESEERYPVLYMFDGHNLFHDEEATFGTSWDLENFSHGFDKDVIIVGMECDHEGQERLQEYCPYALEETFFGPSNGNGEKLFKWIQDDLKPMIDHEYRTWPHREATGIAGSSMGGLMSAYGVIAHNDLFSKGGALSPSLMICLDEFLQDLEGEIDPDTKIYFSFGENELGKEHTQQALQWLGEIRDRLREKGGDAAIYVQPEGAHNEASWQQLNPQWMGYLWKNETPEQTI